MSLRPTFGSLDPSCEQAAWWSLLYGSLDVPLKSPVPHRALDVDGEPEEYYMIDIGQLTDMQFERLAKIMSDKFNVPIAEVRAGMRGEHGVPIRAKLVTTVSFDARRIL